MSTEKYLTYRGDVKALAVVGGTLAFVTAHPEGHATPLYRLDPEKLTLSEDGASAVSRRAGHAGHRRHPVGRRHRPGAL